MVSEILKGNLVGISFSKATQLNIVGADLTEQYIELSPDREAINVTGGGFSSILGAVPYIRYTATIHIRADSPKYETYKEQIDKSAYVEGGVVVTLDNGVTFRGNKVVVNPQSYTADTKTGDGAYSLAFDMPVNQSMLGV